MARRSMPEIAAGVLLILGVGVGAVLGLLHSGGSTDHLSAVVRSLAGATIGGAIGVVALGLLMLVIEGARIAGGRPSNEPTLSDVAAMPEATPASLDEARMYAAACVGCLILGVFLVAVSLFFAVAIMWFAALVFALMARRASGDDKDWRRATTLLFLASTAALVFVLARESGLFSG